MEILKIKSKQLLKACSRLQYVANKLNEHTSDEAADEIDITLCRDAMIKRFEFCYELAWKIMRRILQYRGVEVASPKETFRKAALDHLIDDPEIWFEFQKKRTLTLHTYEYENVKAILATFNLFSKELELLIQKLEVL